jgi:hypothetical protein
VASDVSMGRTGYWLNVLVSATLGAEVLPACRARPAPNEASDAKSPSGSASVTTVLPSASASTPPAAGSVHPNRIPEWRAIEAAKGKRPLVPSFEVTEAVPGGPQTIWLVMPELQLRQALATSRGSHACTVIPRPARDAGVPREPAIGVQVDCGQEQPITVEGASVHLPVFGWIEEPFTIAGKLQPLPADRYVEYDHVSRPTLPHAVCPERSPARTVQLAFAKVGPELLFVAPAVGARERLADSYDMRYLACSTAVLARAERMDLYCSTWVSPSVRVWREDNVVFLETHWYYSDDESASLRAFRLPCAARLSLGGVHFRGVDSAEAGYLNRCSGLCALKTYECAVNCLTRYSDATGAPTSAGEACETRCTDAEGTCTDSCTPR